MNIDIFGKKRIRKLRKEITVLSEEIRFLKNELNARRFIKFCLDETIPKDQIARKNLMRDIAGFYGIIFKKRLEQMKGDQLKKFSMFGLTKVEEDLYRSNLNCLHLIDEWFEDCTKEHFKNLNEVRQSFESDSNIISEIKDKYIN